MSKWLRDDKTVLGEDLRVGETVWMDGMLVRLVHRCEATGELCVEAQGEWQGDGLWIRLPSSEFKRALLAVDGGG